jgi:hypothetical protein
MGILVTGWLKVTKVPKDVKSVLGCNDLLRYGETVFDNHNLVVNIGLQVFSRMLGGNAGLPGFGDPGGADPWGASFGDINELAVDRMVIGNAAFPSTPSPTDTVGITGTPFAPYLSATYPTAYSVAFHGLLAAVEANNPANPTDPTWRLTEEALYTRNDFLFARTIMSVAKDSTFALQFNHSFAFSEA